MKVERRFNRTLNRYLNYSEILAYMLAIDDELEDAFHFKNDVTYFLNHCTHDTAKKQLEKIIINFRSSPIAEMSPFANTLTNWKREIINSFIIVDDKSKRKMNTAIVENRNKSIKLIKHTSNGYLN